MKHLVYYSCCTLTIYILLFQLVCVFIFFILIMAFDVSGSVWAGAETPAGDSVHLVEGHQLSLCQEDQTGDQVPQWRCIHHHTGEGFHHRFQVCFIMALLSRFKGAYKKYKCLSFQYDLINQYLPSAVRRSDSTWIKGAATVTSFHAQAAGRVSWGIFVNPNLEVIHSSHFHLTTTKTSCFSCFLFYSRSVRLGLEVGVRPLNRWVASSNPPRFW